MKKHPCEELALGFSLSMTRPSAAERKKYHEIQKNYRFAVFGVARVSGSAETLCFVEWCDLLYHPKCCLCSSLIYDLDLPRQQRDTVLGDPVDREVSTVP